MIRTTTSILLVLFLVALFTALAAGPTFATGPAFATGFSAATAPANHPVSIVEADILIERGKATIRLKCFAEDLELLQGVEARENGFYDSDELLDATKDHAEYLGEKVILRNADGEILKSKLIETIDIEIPKGGIKSGDLMQYPMSFLFEVRFDSAPEFITIEQKMVADGALLPSELKILMKQAGSDSPYMHMMKPEMPETFQFDWEKPILSKDASEQDWEKWFDDQREKNLGITSYSSSYSFVYITHHEVRHEILIPLATLASFIDLERKESSFLDIDEQAAAAEKIKTFFGFGNPVRIDSVEVKPVFDRIDFYGLSLRDFAIQAQKRKVSMASGRVGIIMSYSTKGSPTKVEVEWDKFNDVLKSIDGVAFAYDKLEKTQFSKFLTNNTYTWNEPDREPLPPITDVSFAPLTLNVPLISAGLIAVAVICLFSGLILRLLGLISRINWYGTALLVAGFGLAAWLTSGLNQVRVVDPFGIASIEDEQARQVFAQLHKNMFRAFDYHHEGDVYDALARSVDGELLRELYLKVNRSLKVKEQGGAAANVDEVNLLDGAKTKLVAINRDTTGFGYRCKWNLVGTIEHWGHIHQRTNQYDAEFEIEVRDKAWKITSMKVLDEKQGIIKTDLRKF